MMGGATWMEWDGWDGVGWDGEEGWKEGRMDASGWKDGLMHGWMD